MDTKPDTESSPECALQTDLSLGRLVLLRVLEYSAGLGLEELYSTTILY